jgi:hypothetical protein
MPFIEGDVKRQYKQRRVNTSTVPNYVSQTLYARADFQTNVNVPRIKREKRQEIESLINEEAFLLARYLRDERNVWTPRIVELI